MPPEPALDAAPTARRRPAPASDQAAAIAGPDRRHRSPICRDRRARPPPLPPQPDRAAAAQARPRCRRPSPNAWPSSPEAVAPASDVRRHSGVAGVADEMRGIDADLRQRPLVFLLEVAIEQQVGVGRAVQPAVGRRSRSRAGRPASRHSRAPGSPCRAPCRRRWPSGCRWWRSATRRRRSAASNRPHSSRRCAARSRARSRPGRRRARPCRPARSPTSSALSGMMLELLQQLAEADVRGALVDDQPHRAFGRVRAHVDHRAREALVGHDRHGDQQLPVEVGVVAAFAFLGNSHGRRLTRECGAWKGLRSSLR